MNYLKLLEGLTFKELEAIAENWYARLNNLKSYYIVAEYNAQNIQCEKAKKLIDEMIQRMLVVSKFYMDIKLRLSIPKRNFKNGAINTLKTAQ